VVRLTEIPDDYVLGWTPPPPDAAPQHVQPAGAL